MIEFSARIRGEVGVCLAIETKNSKDYEAVKHDLEMAGMEVIIGDFESLYESGFTLFTDRVAMYTDLVETRKTDIPLMSASTFMKFKIAEPNPWKPNTITLETR